jgi:TRAP-type C4-dicarboxylate transport system permease small subunit
MMLLTCMDVVGRFFGSPLHGTYDMVKLLGALGISLGLPYTTAVKGHVAVEFFFQNFARPVRLVLDVINRMLVVLLFGVLCFRSVQYGVSLAKAGEVTPTMEIPVFWIPYVLAFSCAIVVLVVLYNLIHPGKVMIKP